MKIDSIELPASINQWKLEGGIRRIDRTHIFDYMNGAGELYLAYHFDHLLVAEYKDGEDNDILVELYLMKSSRDAFGLLSLDWGGETVMFDQPIKKKAAIPLCRRAVHCMAWVCCGYGRIIFMSG